MRKRFWVLPALLLLLLVGWLAVGWLIVPDGERPSLDDVAIDLPDVGEAADQPARNPLPALPDSGAQDSPVDAPADTPEQAAAEAEVADAPQPPGPDKPLEYRLHVEALIVDENGMPLEGANVIVTIRVTDEDDSLLAQPSLMVGPSDGSGLVDRKAMAQVGPGSVTVARSKAVIRPVKEGYFADEPLELDIEPGAWRPDKPLRFVMQTGATIRGRLLNEHGEVEQGLTVRAHGAHAIVNEFGEFELSPVKPGEHELRLNRFGYAVLAKVEVRRPGEVLAVGTLMAQKVAMLSFNLMDGRNEIQGPWTLTLHGPAGREVKPMTQYFARIAPIEPGLYELTIEAEGYQPHVIRSVSIIHGEWTDLGRIDLTKASHSGELAMK